MPSDGLAEATVSPISGPLTGPALLRALDAVGPHPAVIECTGSADETATIWVSGSKLLDVRLGWRTGMPALLRLLTWYDGHFVVQEGPHGHEDVLAVSASEAITWAAETAKQWRRSVAAIGGLEAVFEVSFATLAMRLSEIPDAANNVLRLIDGDRCLRVLLDAIPADEMETLGIVEQLTREGILRLVERAPAPSWIAPPPPPMAVAPAIEVAPITEDALSFTPIEAVPMPPSMPQDAPDASTEWAGEVTAPTRFIRVHRFPLEQGTRRRRIAKEAAGILDRLGKKKERAALLTREVIAPGAIVPPDLTEQMLLDSLDDVLPPEAPPVRPSPRLDDAFEQFFSRRTRRRRALIAALIAVAGGGVVMARMHLRKPPPPPPSPPPPSPLVIPTKPPVPLKSEPTFEQILVAGIKARDEGQNDKAIELLEKAASQRKTAAVEGELGRTYYKAGRLAPAIDALKQATALDPKDTDAYMYLGMSLQDANRIGEAKKAYWQFLRLEPTSTKRYAEIASVVKNLGKH